MRRRLLLADDSVTIQRVIELTFADEDIEVVAVGDGDAALARLDADPPDIVLADVGMPGRDGYDIARHVHRTPSLAHIPVVLLIGALQPLDEPRAKEAGCAGVLVKPFEPNLVIAKVRELLTRGGRPPEAGSPEAPVPAPAAVPQPAAAVDDAASAEKSAANVDDYFARLDAAFATMDAGAGAAGTASSPQPPAPRPDPPAPAVQPPGDAPPSSAAPATAEASPRATMADAFAALLALEQGQSPSRLPDGWPSPLVDVVEEIAQRVAEQVTERVVRAVAPDIVSRVSERIVREEIERVRRELASS